MDAWIWIVIAVVVVLVIVAVVAAAASRRRRHHLQDRFGSEYDRTVEGADRRREAERDLRERGYPVDDFETRSDLVSVDHPDVVENYRTAHGIAARTMHRDVGGPNG